MGAGASVREVSHLGGYSASHLSQRWQTGPSFPSGEDAWFGHL